MFESQICIARKFKTASMWWLPLTSNSVRLCGMSKVVLGLHSVLQYVHFGLSCLVIKFECVSQRSLTLKELMVIRDLGDRTREMISGLTV